LKWTKEGNEAVDSNVTITFRNKRISDPSRVMEKEACQSRRGIVLLFVPAPELQLNAMILPCGLRTFDIEEDTTKVRAESKTPWGGLRAGLEAQELLRQVFDLSPVALERCSRFLTIF
jgi:hypothetical protein